MSVEFFSVVAWLPAAAARRVVAQMETAENLGDLVNEDGSAVHDFGRAGNTINLAACARAMKRRAPRPDDFEGAYVEGFPSGPELASKGRVRIVTSSNFPIISVIDRTVAIPYGVPLMLGRAYRRLRPLARDRAETAWTAMLTTLGGEKKLAARVAPYIDRGSGGIEEALAVTRAITTGFAHAKERDRDLLFAGCLASEVLGEP